MRCLTIVAILLVSIAGCETAASNPCANCGGCCRDFDTCVSGTTDAECGSGGRACAACLFGQACTAGACADLGPVMKGTFDGGPVCAAGWTSGPAATLSGGVIDAGASCAQGAFGATFSPATSPGDTAPCTALAFTAAGNTEQCAHPSGSALLRGDAGAMSAAGNCSCGADAGMALQFANLPVQQH